MLQYPQYPIPNYKNGGIHIKKKNRGKFNALKKRTGKTTEELTHSKNSLTRKRAIFALNFSRIAKKRKKK
ncbi:transcriptional regulator [uncultured phage cr114_1]|uniref:Transcriptional regulator n=1 Tax=uncultured phage cr114_1 TaxID=2772088 RepID=A0A7M1S0N6_9CAUD|nr:transcriptional regulator [uncultured phage cr114_1]QOR59974.1 transcriptional regulator [uncultured phage cr114_1]